MIEPTKGTQCAEVLDYIRREGSITPREAMTFGCYRLAARVKDLRELGWQIVTEREDHDGGEHARYTLKVPDTVLEDAGQLVIFP